MPPSGFPTLKPKPVFFLLEVGHTFVFALVSSGSTNVFLLGVILRLVCAPVLWWQPKKLQGTHLPQQ